MRNTQARLILGVSAKAGPDEIRGAYRKLVMQWHPDREGGDTEIFKKIKEAYKSFEFGSEDFTQGCLHYVTISIEEAFQGCVKEVNGRSFQIVSGKYPSEFIGQYHEDGEEHKVLLEITSSEWSPRWGGDGCPKGDVMKDFKISPFKMIIGGITEVPVLGGTAKAYIHPGFNANSILKIAGGGYWKNEHSLARSDCYLRLVPDIKQMQEYTKEELNAFAKYAESNS